jgi:hypothetical protein
LAKCILSVHRVQVIVLVVETHELAAHQPAQNGRGVGGGVDRSQQEVHSNRRHPGWGRPPGPASPVALECPAAGWTPQPPMEAIAAQIDDAADGGVAEVAIDMGDTASLEQLQQPNVTGSCSSQ